MFAVCYNCGTRQTLNFAVCFYFCRVFIGRAHGIRARLPCVCILCRVSGSQAHGKHGLCRVLPLPCIAFSAHGNQRVSGSACNTWLFSTWDAHLVINKMEHCGGHHPGAHLVINKMDILGAIIQCRERMLYSLCTFTFQINEVTYVNLLVND